LIKGDKARELQAITEDNEVFGKQPRSYQEGARPKKKRFGRRRFSRGGERSDRGERSDSKGDHKKKGKRISRFAKNRKKQS
jgi:hypothetical protein